MTPLRALCQNEKCLRGLDLPTRQWQELVKVRKLLQKFDRATQRISMERHSNIDSYLPTLDWLILSLSEYVAMNTGPLAVAVRVGLEKLEKYELDISNCFIPFAATFLNPALKSNYFKEHDKYANIDTRKITTTISDYITKCCDTKPVQPSRSSSKRQLEVDSNESEDDELSVQTIQSGDYFIRIPEVRKPAINQQGRKTK